MKPKIIVLITLFLLTSFAYADGGVWYGYGRDVFHPLTQSRQICSIDYRDGSESMLLSIKTGLEGEKAIWIFPIPATPEETEIDVVKEFPTYRGYEVTSKAGYTIHEATYPMALSQVWLFIPRIIIHFEPLGLFNIGGGVTYMGAGRDSGLIIHRHMEKSGLTTELVTSVNEDALNDYLQDKGMSLPDESLSVIKEYIGEEYSFVVSWISDVEEYRKETAGEVLAVKIRFPTKRIYYPLRLTSIYGEARIPVVVYVNGYVSPDLYEDIKDASRVGYYANDEGLKYTKININTESNSFTKDLWIDDKTPTSVLIAEFIATNSILSLILFFAFYSCLASLISGLIVFRRELPAWKLALLGLSNFLTLIGFALAARFFIKTDEKGKIIDKKRLIKGFLLIVSILALSYLTLVVIISLDSMKIVSYNILSGIAFVIFSLLLILLGGVLTILTLVIIASLISKSRKEANYIVLFSILFLIITVSCNWILVTAFPLESHGSSMATGWSKLQSEHLVYRTDGSVDTTFINTLSTTIKITDVTIKDKLGGYYRRGGATYSSYEVNCSPVLVNGEYMPKEVTVTAKEVFDVATLCDANKTVNNPYDLLITIEYESVEYGITTRHTESGHIRGPVE